MCSAQVTAPDRSAGLSSPAWHVVEVQPLSGYRLRVRFADGLTGEIDLRALIERADAGVFEALRTPDIFDDVRIEHGAVSWFDRVDLAPDALYACVLRSGSCALS